MTRRRRRIFVLIPDGTGERVLAVPQPEGWTLPSWESYTIGDWRNVAWVNRAVAKRFGLRVTTLRPVGIETEGPFWRRAYYALENHEPGRTAPEGSRWVRPDELAFDDDRDRAACECWVTDEAHFDPLTAPWARPGWLDETSVWLDGVLARLGRPRTGPVEQRASLSISCVLRATTGDGDVYVKAVPVFFADEPRLTQALSAGHPGAVPEVLAIDVERRVLVMEDFGGKRLVDTEDAGPWQRALRLLATIQRAWAERTAEVRSFGCPDRGLDQLEAEIPALLGSDEALRIGQSEGLSAAETARLPALESALHEACARLRRYEVPPTLIHGDFHSANVQVRRDDPLIFDWSDGSVSHPFFDLVPFFDFADELELPLTWERLRDAYLEAWSDVAPWKRLREAFDLAQYVGLFYHALAYRRLTLGVEPRSRWEWEDVVPYFVRRLLESEPPR